MDEEAIQTSLPSAYRACVGVMLINARGLVFMGRRIDTLRDNWQMPQGGIDPDEEPEVAVLRELYEETGISADKVRILHADSQWRHYDLPPRLIPKFWGGRYRGQKQKWFLLAFLGRNSDICLETNGTDAEFSCWKWVEAQELPTLIIEFKRALYTQLVQDFTPHIRHFTDSLKDPCG